MTSFQGGLPRCFKALRKKRFAARRSLRLGDKDIDYVPILIHGPPQVATLALDGYE